MCWGQRRTFFRFLKRGNMVPLGQALALSLISRDLSPAQMSESADNLGSPRVASFFPGMEVLTILARGSVPELCDGEAPQAPSPW